MLGIGQRRLAGDHREHVHVVGSGDTAEALQDAPVPDGEAQTQGGEPGRFRQGLQGHDVLEAANGVFGGFTGHLDRLPGVTFVNDEARSYLERTPSRHDIIQVTLIDTWAATSVGAFALTENSLYTVEAWDLFLNRLSE